MRKAKDLDLILETRLDVLTQAVEEVNCVIKAVRDQDDRLNAVGDFLSKTGVVQQAANNLKVLSRDVQTRVDTLLGDVSSPGPATACLSADDLRRLAEVLNYTASAVEQIDGLTTSRLAADTSFQDIRRWSVAGLGDGALQGAVDDYKLLIEEIRTADRPWRSYQAQMPRLDHKLFSRYLELVASMAVRGFGLDPDGQSDVHRLIGLVKGPEDKLGDKSATSPRSPLALMSSLGRRHMPLGYPEWSLWALPLLGRAAGERVASLLPPRPDNRLRIICGDLYAQYVLGPSYLHAAVFLEFDPRADPPRANLPSDSLRATILLQNLREYGAGDSTARQLIEGIAEPVEREWRRARAAVGGQERDLDPEERKVVDGFVQDLRDEYHEIGFTADGLEGLRDTARELLTAGQDGSETRITGMSLPDLMGAMWLARLMDPAKARLIHQRAKAVPRLGQGESSSSRIGLAPFPRSTTWA